MKLFLCSHFSSVGSLIKEEIDNKKVAFIPTASLREGYTGYVGSARKLFNKLGAAVTEIDISTEAYLTIQSVFEDADVVDVKIRFGQDEPPWVLRRHACRCNSIAHIVSRLSDKLSKFSLAIA